MYKLHLTVLIDRPWDLWILVEEEQGLCDEGIWDSASETMTSQESYTVLMSEERGDRLEERGV